MRVIIVRHAKTDSNVKKVVSGQKSKVLLNELGVEQAKKLGLHLRREKISHAYLSPQSRVLHTAKEILAHHPKVKNAEVKDLLEGNTGIYEDRPKTEIIEARLKSKELFHLFKPEKGESYEEIQLRAVKFFHKLLKDHGYDDTILIVSHAGTIGMLLLHLLEKEITEENYKSYRPDNTAVTILDISKNGQVDFLTINNLDHLIEEH